MSGFDGIDRAVAPPQPEAKAIVVGGPEWQEFGKAAMDLIKRVGERGYLATMYPSRPDLEAIRIARRDRNRAKAARRKMRGK